MKVAKYTFSKGSYAIEVAHEMPTVGQPRMHMPTTSSSDDKAPEGESAMVSTFTGPAFYCRREVQKLTFDDIIKR